MTHLFFVDDCFLFFKATLDESQAVKDNLHKYEIASGQQINFHKSAISFSSNTPEEAQHEICMELNVHITSDHGRYLGLPSLIGRLKKEVFAYIKERARGGFKVGVQRICQGPEKKYSSRRLLRHYLILQ